MAKVKQILNGAAGHSHAPYQGDPVATRRTAWATGVSFLMMLVEITAGYVTGSMALLADGWHMATHVLALGLSLVAFVLTKRLANDRRFAFGSGKLEVLASFVSALLLLAVAFWMGMESIARLLHPVDVQFGEAMVVAVIGLWVNLVCALLLHQKSGAHGHGHSHGHGHHSHDHGADLAHENALNEVSSENLNLKAAYVHVLADAATSVFAIVALLIGQFSGLRQIDSLIGLLGAFLVAFWAKDLIRQSASVLLDMQAPDAVLADVEAALKDVDAGVQITRLKVWLVASGRYACNVVLVAESVFSSSVYRERLSRLEYLDDITVESVSA
jgi:cation diffusion facilitator family transporter